MFWFKKLWKDERLRYIVISLVPALLVLALRRPEGFFTIISDLFFSMGAVHIIIGCSHYISNVGLYKTFSYMGYKWRWKRHGLRHGEARPMTLAEYTMNVINDENRMRPVAWPVLFGIGCWVVSVLLSFI